MRLTALINCTEDHLTLGDCLASVIQQGPTIELIFLACPEGLGAASREFARRACKEHASVTVIEGDKGDAEFKQALLRTGPGFLMIIDGQGVLEAEAARTLLPALLDGPPAVALTSWRWADGAGNPLEGALAGLGSAGVDRELLNNPWVQGLVLIRHDLAPSLDLPGPIGSFGRWELALQAAELGAVSFVEQALYCRRSSWIPPLCVDLRASRRGNEVRRRALERRGLVREAGSAVDHSASTAAALASAQLARNPDQYRKLAGAGLALLLGPGEMRLLTLSELLFTGQVRSSSDTQLIVFPGRDEPLDRLPSAVQSDALGMTLVVGDTEAERQAARLYNCYFDQVCFLSAEAELSVSSYLWRGCQRERAYKDAETPTSTLS